MFMNSFLSFPRTWKGIAPALITAVVSSLSIALFSTILYSMGKQEEDSREFIPEYITPDINKLRMMYTMSYIRKSSEKNDIVFLGDSTCSHGVDAEKIEKITRRSAFNLACLNITFLGWDGALIAFEKYIANRPKPKVLVICVSADAYKGYGSSFGEYRKIFMNAYGSDATRSESPHSPTEIYYIKEGARILCNKLNFRVYSMYNATAASYYKLDENKYKTFNDEQRGSWILEGSGDFEVLQHPISVSELSAAQMNKICEICSANNIRILVKIMPTRRDIIKDKSGIDILDSFLQGLKSTWSNLSVSQPLILNWEDDYFYDCMHLNSRGAERMTKLLADELDNILK